MPANKNPLKPDPGTVAVRLYGQGLGDCFLLAFPRPDAPDAPCYLVIDCGVAAATPDAVTRMNQVVEDIRQATGGELDILVITHQHYDHISGFLQARDIWKQIKVKALYLPWTEATNERQDADTLTKLRDALNRAAEEAIERTAETGTLDAHPALRAESGFLGIDEAGGFGVRGKKGSGKVSMDEAMQFARELCRGNVYYFEPGEVFRVPGTESHGYVLGPPLPSQKDPEGRSYIELLSDEAEMYHYGDFPGIAVDEGTSGGRGTARHSFSLDANGLAALASGLMAAGSASDAAYRANDDVFSPFPASVRLEWDEVMGLDFFRTYYGNASPVGTNGSWRRIDNDWLAGAESLALRAGNFTNNISLVLAFDVPGSDKMLLFVGDAQVGNWLSWHTITGWRPVGDASPQNPPARNKNQTLMENLLGRVAFYKVGHHGSHNATIRQKGLELMTHPDLMAYIPVSIPVAQDLMGYCPMPFYPVVRRLQEKTKGRVFLANGKAVDQPPTEKKPGPLHRAAGVTPAKTELGPIVQDGKTLEGASPLYLEITVNAGAKRAARQHPLRVE